jgi:apolipoprotein N-acyltransferase
MKILYKKIGNVFFNQETFYTVNSSHPFKKDIVLCFFYGLLCAIGHMANETSYLNSFIYILGITNYLRFFYERNFSLKQTIFLNSVFFYSYYGFTLYWVSFCLVSLNLWWLVPFSQITFPLVFLVFHFWLGFILYFARLKSKNTYALIMVFSFWLSELCASHLLTGFPWVLSAYTLGNGGMQLAAYIGTYGVSLLVLILAALVYAKGKKRYFFIPIFFMLAFSEYRINEPDLRTNTTVRLVHPCISQKNKMKNEEIQKNLETHLALSALNGEKKIDILVWPEAVLPIALNKYPHVIGAIQDIIPNDGYAVIGSPRIDENKGLFTSAFVLDAQKTISIYDKIHTVPFGEFLPFRPLLAKFGISNIAMGNHDYQAGNIRETLTLKNIPPFAILICYDVIFPNKVLNTDDGRSEWLLNITNDAWYLGSCGIYQHLRIVRWRAVEEGLPIVRCTNSGVSAIIDGLGRIQSRLEWDNVGIIDDFIPQKQDQTVYSKIRNFFFK